MDMHSHTMFSGDSTTTLDEIHDSVVESGIDVLCITDHNAIEGALRLQKLLENVCRVIVGEEVRTHTGEVIGLFLTEKISYGASAAATCQQIRQQGGVVYVPHPFDPMRKNLTEASLIEIADAGLVDAGCESQQCHHRDQVISLHLKRFLQKYPIKPCRPAS